MVENIECIAFKRDCGAEPQSVVERPKLLMHQQSCELCAEYYQSMLALDSQLMNALVLPIASASVREQYSVVDGVSHAEHGFFETIKKRWIKPGLAAFASLLAAALGFFALQYPAAIAANDVIEHIHHEPDLLTLTSPMTSPEKIKMVLQQTNVSLTDSNLEILSAKLCPLDGQLTAHLIVKGETGPVTLFILPAKSARAGSIETTEFNGRILSAEHGMIAVVGGKKENLEGMQSRLLSAFHWQD